MRKLRAGVMPPPACEAAAPGRVRRRSGIGWKPRSIAKAATRLNPGSVVLHRLNRTEYANVIRDLLDLEIDATTLLPPDDSARGFDNIAGSLTISPTLLEAYATAAARVARMAVGYWKTPTESTYLAPGDTSQNQHIEGLPFGTRGGMLVRHDFPGGWRVQVLDPELRDRQLYSRRATRAHDRRRASRISSTTRASGLRQGMSGEGDGALRCDHPG